MPLIPSAHESDPTLKGGLSLILNPRRRQSLDGHGYWYCLHLCSSSIVPWTMVPISVLLPPSSVVARGARLVRV